MSLTYPSGYYNRFDPAQNYDQHLFRADYVLQSAELNEIQRQAAYRTQTVGDALFQDGAIVRGCEIVVSNGGTTCQLGSGVMYLAGMARGIPSGVLSLDPTATYSIGIFLGNEVVTPTTDSSLKDPAVGLLNYAEPGAYRLQREPAWGYFGQVIPSEQDFPENADFYPVYTVIAGVVQPHATPPNVQAVNLAIARYDVQSSGSNYVSSGFHVSWLDDVDGNQIFNIGAGIARIGGAELDLIHGIRYAYTPVPDTQTITAEPHNATAGADDTITLDWPPLASLTQILINKRVADESVTRSDEDQDVFQHNPILSITDVWKGATHYTQGTGSDKDYYLDGTGKINWNHHQNEPGLGETYHVNYVYIANYPNEEGILGDVTDTTVQVLGAIQDTTVYVTYRWKLPRYDRIGIKADGAVVYVPGVAAASHPLRPRMPTDCLLLATIHQTWDTATRYLAEDMVRMVPMRELASMNRRIDDLFSLVADCRLAINISAHDADSKRGLFVDSFRDNALRDLGIDQNAAVINGTLTLSIDTVIYSGELTENLTLAVGSSAPFITQPYITGTTLVNPYRSYALNARVFLTPAMDLWTDIVNTVQLSQGSWQQEKVGAYTSWRWVPIDHAAEMQRFANLAAAWISTRSAEGTLPANAASLWINNQTGLLTTGAVPTNVQTDYGYGVNRLVSTAEAMEEHLRQITVHFRIDGFGPGSPGEALTSVKFDGQTIAVSAP